MRICFTKSCSKADKINSNINMLICYGVNSDLRHFERGKHQTSISSGETFCSCLAAHTPLTVRLECLSHQELVTIDLVKERDSAEWPTLALSPFVTEREWCCYSHHAFQKWLIRLPQCCYPCNMSHGDSSDEYCVSRVFVMKESGTVTIMYRFGIGLYSTVYVIRAKVNGMRLSLAGSKPHITPVWNGTPRIILSYLKLTLHYICWYSWRCTSRRCR